MRVPAVLLMNNRSPPKRASNWRPRYRRSLVVLAMKLPLQKDRKHVFLMEQTKSLKTPQVMKGKFWQILIPELLFLLEIFGYLAHSAKKTPADFGDFLSKVRFPRNMTCCSAPPGRWRASPGSQSESPGGFVLKEVETVNPSQHYIRAWAITVTW